MLAFDLLLTFPRVIRLLKIYNATDPDAVTVKASHRVTLLLGQKALASKL
jgi:hypothetical protein